jgi:hypothetical protein
MKLKIASLFAVSLFCLSLITNVPAQQLPGGGDLTAGADNRKGHGTDDQDPFLRRVRVKAAIETAEAENNKMKSESLQLFEFAEEIHDAVLAKSLNTPENFKKLANIEKLAKDIREKSGGTGDNDKYDAPPTEFGDCVKLLNEYAEKLNKDVEKTSRFTTSAAVIDKSNRILFLVRHMRKIFYNK